MKNLIFLIIVSGIITVFITFVNIMKQEDNKYYCEEYEKQVEKLEIEKNKSEVKELDIIELKKFEKEFWYDFWDIHNCKNCSDSKRRVVRSPTLEDFYKKKNETNETPNFHYDSSGNKVEIPKK